MLLDSLKTFIAAIGSVHINIASRYNALARLYLDKKDFEKAEVLFKIQFPKYSKHLEKNKKKGNVEKRS